MTDQELLQQAKDQVAQKWATETGHHYIVQSRSPWTHVIQICSPYKIDQLANEAALLSIQSAREEAEPKWVKLEPMPSSVPIPGRAVFVWIPGLSVPSVGYRIHGEMGFHVEGHVTENVTHWMELPKDPI